MRVLGQQKANEAVETMKKPEKEMSEYLLMTPRKLIEYVSAEPFRPFQINMASGQAFEVRHPENIAVSRSSAKIFMPAGDSDTIDRWHDVSLLLIETVEPFETSLTQDQN